MELVGISEAAQVLGWSRQKTAVYYQRGKLPKPLARLRCGPVWKKKVIVAFGAAGRSGVDAKTP